MNLSFEVDQERVAAVWCPRHRGFLGFLGHGSKDLHSCANHCSWELEHAEIFVVNVETGAMQIVSR